MTTLVDPNFLKSTGSSTSTTGSSSSSTTSSTTSPTPWKRSTSTSTSTLDDKLLTTTVSNILGLQSQADIDAANAAAATASATGSTAEAEAYAKVGALAEQNSVIAGVSGQIQQLQAARKLAGVIGTQKAQVAGYGFAEAGSSVDILKSSLQQGALTQQLIQSQTAITQGGYLEEAAAAQGSATAASAAATAQTDLAAMYTKAGETSKSTSASEITALNKLLQGTTLTDAEKLILAPLSGTSGSDILDTLLSGTGGGKSTSPTAGKGGGIVTISQGNETGVSFINTRPKGL